MRIAAIDIGTNSLHMLIVQVRADLSFEDIDREKAMVRLGAGGLSGRRLTQASMTAALEALRRFRRLADAHQVDEVLAAATSATRGALNGSQFLPQGTRVAAVARDVLSDDNDPPVRKKVSLRSTDGGVDVSVIARAGGGGGHRQAAGYTTTMVDEQPVDFLRQQVASQLDD